MIANRFYTAAVVPFAPDGSIDEPAYREQVRYFCDPRFASRGGYIANAEAGELYYLSAAEKRRVTEIALDEINGRMPVFTGIFDLTTADSVASAVVAKEMGVDGLFLMPPAGCADLVTSWNASKYPEYWLDQIRAIDDAVGLPIIAHPVATQSPMWGIGVPGDAAKLICETVHNIIGWKMIYSYEGMRRMWRILRALDHPVAIMAAGGRFFHEYLAHDVLEGSVSGSWVYAMEPMLDHIDAARSGDFTKARSIWNEGGLGSLHDYIYDDYSRLHLRYKIAAWLRGLIPSPRARPPMPRPKAEEIATLRRLMANAQIEIIADAAIQGELASAS
jgi:4-hydroxy-tetrahydrodipicolinate synthase